MNKMQYKIRGMDCAEEVKILRKTVGSLPDVAQLDFDILNGKMTVTLDGDSPTEEAVVIAVARTGMQAVPWRDGRAIPSPPGL